jgi:tetratricopeptide (TPR) repeat protein
MRPPRRTLLWILALLAGCASAGKRLEQGLDAEAQGDFQGAVSRYIEAVVKDPDLLEARASLIAAWDSAVARGLEAAGVLGATDPDRAAGEFLALDRLRVRARDAGVALDVPVEYGPLRRSTLDDAIDQVMARGEADRRDGRWRDAQEAYRRVLDDLDPLRDQRRGALDAKASGLLQWAEDEAREGRFRAAYERAVQAVGVDASVPPDISRAARDLQERSLSSGLRIMAVFPLSSTDQVRQASLTDLEGPLSDLLDSEHWRRPPLFVGVADPPRARLVSRRMSPPGTTLRPRRILEELGADFGVLVDLTELEVEQRDVKTSTRTARTRGGQATSYTLEEGRIQYRLMAEVTLFDAQGNRMESFRATHTAGDRYRTARYSGAFEELDLSRSEALLFNPGEERARRADLQESLLEELAAEIAEGTFERLVRRIP